MKLSVIVPAFNAERTLPACLEALKANDAPDVEVIVVDDGSTDRTAEIANRAGARVVRNVERQGPGSARNCGAQNSTGEILFFVDADVTVRKDTISRVLALFQNDPDLAAVFGSYDDSPAAANFLSQYKNLLHHFVHQQSNEKAVTFWAGCGAIRKRIFQALGGFNWHEYPHPSIEDIELGIRLVKQRYTIRLEKSLQVKHLKEWRTYSLLKADILYRAIPWSRLILRSGFLPGDLNLHWRHRISAGLTGLLFLALLSVLFVDWIVAAAAGLATLLLLVLLNRDVYIFFAKTKGILFTAGVIPWHLFYYFYSGVTFVSCWFEHMVKPFSRNAGKQTQSIRPQLAQSESLPLPHLEAEPTALKSRVVE